MTTLRLTGIGVLLVGTLFSQSSDTRSEYLVRGEVSKPANDGSTLTIELSGSQAGATETTFVDPNGTFEFRSVQGGWHQLRVIGAGGAILHQETIFVNGTSQNLSIELASRPNPVRSADPTVSVQQLTHKIPAAARKAFQKGEQAIAKGNHQQAIECLREAVALDPQFADAFSELGAEEAATGDFQHAIEEFQKAINIVPEHRQALANLSIDLLKLQRYGEAVIAARRALQVNPGSGTVHYVLAVGLLAEKGSSEEVLDNLDRAGNDVPHARLLAASLLAREGKREEAINHAEAFLRTAPPDDKDRSRAEALLAQLRQ